jgi:predicted DNA-binding transcriptional regulator AlpA
MKQEVSLVLPPEGFVRLPVVIRIMGIGKTTWWNGIKNGRYPKPVKLGPRMAAWRVEDIRALIADPAKGVADAK